MNFVTRAIKAKEVARVISVKKIAVWTLAGAIMAISGWQGVSYGAEALNEWQTNREINVHLQAQTELAENNKLLRKQVEANSKSWEAHQAQIEVLNAELGK